MTTRAHAPLRPEAPRGLGYLPGLDGLRAVSVTAVLLYHAQSTGGGAAWLPGGFLGVEVFFVISGYLITLLLLNEYERDGSVSLRSFWLRRARRLLPALFLLLLTTVVVAATWFPETLADLKGLVASAFTYCTNWYEIVTGQSYFAAAGRPPFLRHLWSLAVEEQFYVLWPLLLLGLVRLTGNRRRPMAATVALLAAGSAVLMAVLYQPGHDPSRVYYGTDTRASGLLAGAVLAFVWRPRELTARSAPASEVAGLAGVGALVASFTLVHEWDRFLYRGGLVVVDVATVAVIAAVVHPHARVAPRALGNPLLAWVGLRSYSLYLWHWPIFVVTRPGVDLGWSPGPTLVLRFALTLAAAELSYRFVEMPIRNGAIRRLATALRTTDGKRRLLQAQALGAAAVVAAAVVLPATADLAQARKAVNMQDAAVGFEPAAQPGPVPTTTGTPATTTAADPAAIAATAPPTSAAATPTTVTVLTDSVLLRVKDEVTAALADRGWTVDYRGKAALMLDQATAALRAAGRPVGDVVVIGLGYNSLWERDRAHYDSWAAKFDREADELLATLSELGAKRFVWVTLREPSRDILPKGAEAEYRQYAWFFPYANERIRLLPQRHPNLVLADWTAISDVRGLTGDLIHLNPTGTELMIDLILRTGGF